MVGSTARFTGLKDAQEHSVGASGLAMGACTQQQHEKRSPGHPERDHSLQPGFHMGRVARLSRVMEQARR